MSVSISSYTVILVRVERNGVKAYLYEVYLNESVEVWWTKDIEDRDDVLVIEVLEDLDLS